MNEPEAPIDPKPLSALRSAGITALVMLAAGIGQMAGTVLVGVTTGRLDLSDPHVGERADGLLFVAGVLGAVSLALPLLWFLLRRRSPRTYLAIASVPPQRLAMWMGVALATLALSQGANLVFDRPLVPPEWFEAIETSPSVALVVFGLVVLAPLLEEALFRGFLYRAVSDVAGTHGVPIAIGITAILFALAHFPGDVLAFVQGLVMGVVLGLARAHTGSIVTTLAMHALVNGAAILYLIAAR
jgi:hypothetical protein